MTPYRTLLIVLTCAACTQFPEIDAARSSYVDQAEYPNFLSVDSFGAAPSVQPPDFSADTNRIAQLRAKADRMRRPILTAADRRRINRGISS
ncbi:MAG: hypothetical protein AAF386_05390 [Pseudomonadota bacterium]